MKLLFILVLIGTSIFSGCKSDEKKSKAVELTVGIQKSPSNSLVIIADQKGFFDTSKVRVMVKDFTAGKFALQALLSPANDLQIAVCAETPVALSSLAGNKVKIISQVVDANNECRVVVRKQDNLNTPEEYFSKKRKLATSIGGSPEWTAYNFIKANQLDKSKIEIVSMKPEDQPAAISSGAIDAICIFDPFARFAEKQLGENGLTFLNSSLTSYYVLCVKEQTIIDNKDALIEFLEGLKKAQQFIAENPEEAKSIIANYTKLDKTVIDDTWKNYNFKIGIDNSLNQLLIDESNWAIETDKYPKGTSIPDYTHVLDADLLDQLNVK
jgi:NitT/TauT family transport system substrate-binding protein